MCMCMCIRTRKGVRERILPFVDALGPYCVDTVNV